MAVKLRMKRMGNTHRPYYRIVSVDERKKRDGRVIEQLGTYDPMAPDEARQVKADLQRCAYWLSVGAQPSETVASLLKRQGLTPVPGTNVEAQDVLKELAATAEPAPAEAAAAAPASEPEPEPEPRTSEPAAG